MNDVVTWVASCYGLTADQLYAKGKMARVSRARQVCMMILLDQMHLSYREVAKVMGRSAGTVNRGVWYRESRLSDTDYRVIQAFPIEAFEGVPRDGCPADP